jgi:hypothetical protein
MCATGNLSQSPNGDNGSKSEYILQNEDKESEDMYIPQVVPPSEIKNSDSNVESKDAGAANDKTPTPSRKRSNRRILYENNRSLQTTVAVLYYVILG